MLHISSTPFLSCQRSKLTKLLFSMLLLCLEMTAFAQSKVTPTKDSHVLLLAAGDIADCRKTPAETSNAALTASLVEQEIKQVDQGYVVTLGDSTYPIGAISEFRDCYDKTWGKFKSKTLPSPGNHEYGVPEAKGYFGYFGDAAGSRERSYYKKNIGTWRFISLNSNLKGTAMQEQLDWLKNELKNKDASCTLAFWHHPRFSTGGHRDNDFMEPIWRLLSNANIDLVLSGHDHNYERLAPLNADGERDNLKGTRSFIVGTGGAKLTPMFFPRAMTEVRQNEVHGILKLRLFKASYDWEFLPVSGSTFKDRGQATCH